MGDSEKRKLSELRVKDLRLELGLRGLDKTGTKQVLMKRLEEALEEEGKDPKTYIFGEDEDCEEELPLASKEEEMNKENSDAKVQEHPPQKSEVPEDAEKEHDALEEEHNEAIEEHEEHNEGEKEFKEGDEADDKAGEEHKMLKEVPKDAKGEHEEAEEGNEVTGEEHDDAGDEFEEVVEDHEEVEDEREEAEDGYEQAEEDLEEAEDEHEQAEESQEEAEDEHERAEEEQEKAEYEHEPADEEHAKVKIEHKETKIEHDKANEPLEKGIQDQATNNVHVQNNIKAAQDTTNQEASKNKEGPKVDVSQDTSNGKKQNVSVKIEPVTEQKNEKQISDRMKGTRKNSSEATQIDEPVKIKEPIVKKKQDGESKVDNQEDTEENKKKAKDKTVQKRKESSTNPNVLWISNISKSTRANELRSAFYKCGRVVNAKVVLNAKYPGSNCFGHVTMDSVEAVQTAIDTLNNTELNGRIIQVHRFDEVRLDQQRKAVSSRPERKEPLSSAKPIEKKEKVPPKPNDKPKDTELKAPPPPRFKSRGEPSRYSRDRHHHESNEDFKERSFAPRRSNPQYRDNRSAFLNFERIKEVRREQQQIRDERVHRENIKRVEAERNRQKEIDERARRERRLIEKEKEELRMEKEKLEREKERLKKLEQEQFERDRIKKEAQALKQTINIIEEFPNRKRPRSPPPPPPPRRYQGASRHFESRYRNGGGSPDRRRPKFEPSPYQGRRDSSPPRRTHNRERGRRPEDRGRFDSRNDDRYQTEFRPPPRRYEHGPRCESPPARNTWYPDRAGTSDRGDFKGEVKQNYTNRDPRSYNPMFNRDTITKPNNFPQSQIRYSPPGSWGYMPQLQQPIISMQNQGHPGFQPNMNPMGMPAPPAPSIGSYNYGLPIRRF